MDFNKIIPLQSKIRKFLAKHHVEERKIAYINSIALKNNTPLFGMIVVYNFDDKNGVICYKYIDDAGNFKVEFVFLLKKFIPEKYIPHRDFITFQLIPNPIKNDKKMAKIISVTKRSEFSYKNLRINQYEGKITKSKKDIIYIYFKYHQMSYRTQLEFQDIPHNIELENKIKFNLNNRFRACNIVKSL